MVNKVILIGAIGADPEVKTTRADEPMARMRIATNRRVQRAGQWEDETEWHTVVAFGKSADFAGKYLKKGRQVYVEGRLQTNTWVDKNRIERQSTSIVVETIRGLGKREDDQGASRRTTGGYDDEAPF